MTELEETNRLRKEVEKERQSQKSLMAELTQDAIAVRKKYQLKGQDFSHLIYLDMLTDEEFETFTIGLKIVEALTFDESTQERMVKLINKWFRQRLEQVED